MPPRNNLHIESIQPYTTCHFPFIKICTINRTHSIHQQPKYLNKYNIYIKNEKSKASSKIDDKMWFIQQNK
jgi:hypothetical protein